MKKKSTLPFLHQVPHDIPSSRWSMAFFHPPNGKHVKGSAFPRSKQARFQNLHRFHSPWLTLPQGKACVKLNNLLCPKIIAHLCLRSFDGGEVKKWRSSGTSHHGITHPVSYRGSGRQKLLVTIPLKDRLVLSNYILGIPDQEFFAVTY